MSKNDGGPAFPHLALDRGADGNLHPYGTELQYGGMTLRDYFAIHAPEPTKDEIASAMQREQLANPHNDSYKPTRHGEREIRCILRYQYADAMLAERAK